MPRLPRDIIIYRMDIYIYIYVYKAHVERESKMRGKRIWTGDGETLNSQDGRVCVGCAGGRPPFALLDSHASYYYYKTKSNLFERGRRSRVNKLAVKTE